MSATARRVLFPLLAVGLTVALALICLEVVLRLAPGILRPGLGNHVYSKYGTFAGGMYFGEPRTHTQFMRRNFSTEAYWNGYRWLHETDEFGFRNPDGVENKSILLLGDSLIYGHGVDVEDTAAEVLRTEFGRPVYNMARQGDCLYQNYVLSRLYLERFRPKKVVLFIFGNDVSDLLTYRSLEQLEEAEELNRTDYDEIYSSLAALDEQAPDTSRARWHRFLVWRLKEGVKIELAKRPLSKRLSGSKKPARKKKKPHKSIRMVFRKDKLEPALRYYDRTLTDLVFRTRQNGTRLKIVFLDVGEELGPRSVRAQKKFAHHVKEIARENRIPYRSTKGLWDDCSNCFLENDGHLTPEGNRVLAEFLHRRVL